MSDIIPNEIVTREGIVMYGMLRDIKNDLENVRSTVNEVRTTQITRATVDDHERRLKSIESMVSAGKSFGVSIMQKVGYALIGLFLASDVLIKIATALKHGTITP